MKKYLGLFVLALSASLAAQTQVVPTSYQVRFYQTDTSPTVVASTLLPSSAYTCNVTPSTALPVGRYVALWDDPSDARTWDNNPATVPNECRYVDPGSGGFVTSPPNVTVYVTLRGGVVQNGVIVYGAESSPRYAFTNWVVPNAPPGFRVVPGQSATLTGSISNIGPNWLTPDTPTSKLADLSGPFGPFQVMLGTPDGVVSLPGYGEVKAGDRYAWTIVHGQP